MKTCNKEGCSYPRFGGGFCKYHQYLREDKTPAKIKPQSDKQKERLKVYNPKRDKFLKENPVCMIEDCKKPSTLHHSRGRRGNNLTDESTFRNLCEDHHRYYETHPAEAKKLGISGSRLGRE